MALRNLVVWPHCTQLSPGERGPQGRHLHTPSGWRRAGPGREELRPQQPGEGGRAKCVSENRAVEAAMRPLALLRRFVDPLAY